MKGMYTGFGKPQAIFAGLEVPDSVYAVVLTAGSSQSIAIPSGANFVLFNADSNADIWVKLTVGSTTISVPVGNVVDGTAPELNPMMRAIGTNTYINLITAATGGCKVTFSFWS